MKALLLVCGAVACVPSRSTVRTAWEWLGEGKDQQLAADNGLDPSARTLFARAIVRHERGDFEAAWSDFAAVLKGQDRRDPWWPTLAELAIGRIEGLWGELARPEARRKSLAELDSPALPALVRHRLRLILGDMARRAGDLNGAREAEASAGCPRTWYVAGPFGRHAHLDLGERFAPEEGAAKFSTAIVHQCRVEVRAPQSKPGVLYAGGWFHLDARAEVLATVDLDEAFVLFVDGTQVYASRSQDRIEPRTHPTVFTAARGWHQLLLKGAAPSGQLSVSLSAQADGISFFDGNAAQAPAVTAAPLEHVHRLVTEPKSMHQATNWEEDFWLAELALRRHDSDRAEEYWSTAVADAPRAAVAQVLGAAIAADDSSRPARFASDRVRRRIERALALDPQLARARYALAAMEVDAKHPREALALLSADDNSYPSRWRAEFLRNQALKARGWAFEAEEALARARALNPIACAPLLDELALRRSQHDYEKATRLAGEVRRCPEGENEMAELLRASGRTDEAAAEYQRLYAADPSRDSTLSNLAETLGAAGRYVDARKWWQKLVDEHPKSVYYRQQLADTLVALGERDRARQLLEAGLGFTPESEELHRALDSLCVSGKCGAIEPYRLEGRAIIAEYERDKRRPRYQSPAVIVLDRTVTRVFGTGARLTLTHNIIQVLAKDGIDKWGEVQIPEGAEILTLRTVKADGTVREPEAIAEKQAISAPDLEVGDYIEFEYVDPAPPAGAFPDGFTSERFFFQSYDAPLDRTEYLVVVPRGMKLDIDRRGEAPEPTRRTDDPRAVDLYEWAGRYRKQVFAEPATTPFSEYVPSVRVASAVSFAAWRDHLRDEQFGVQRSNDQMRKLALQVTQGLFAKDDKVSALDAWVRANIKQGGLIDEAATITLARGEGNRVTLLAALLRAVHIPSEIWLVRPMKAPRLDGPLADLDGYDQAVLKVGDVYIDPRYRHMPTGELAPWLRGVPALALGSGPLGMQRTPEQNDDGRKMDFQVRLAADGSAEVRVSEQLTGWPALEWREAIEKLPPDKLRPQFEQQTLGYYFPGATLLDLKWTNDGESLVVQYAFRTPVFGRRIGGRLVVGAPFPAMLSRHYAGAAERRTPLQLDYVTTTELSADFDFPAGVDIEVAAPATAKTDFAFFEQKVEKRSARRVELHSRIGMKYARITQAQYPALVDFVRTVDNAEARALEVRSTK